MRNRLFALSLAFALTFGAVADVLAKGADPRGDWAAVEALASGTKLSIRTKEGDRFSGRFDSATDILLVIERGGGRKMSLTRDSILRVQLDRGKSRMKGFLFGTAIGGAIGFGVGSALYFPNRDDIVGTSVVGGAALGMLIGAGIGAGLGKGNKNETIYEAP